MAKQAKATAAPSGLRNTKAMRMEQAARRRRNQNRWIYGIAAVLVLLVVLAIALVIRNAQPVAGEETLASQGNVHIPMGDPTPLYNSTPPTSGPHYDQVAAWQLYDEPQRYELLVHNLEDGGVVVYYQCADGCPETVAQLKDILAPYLDAGRHVVLVPNDPTWTNGNSQPLHQDMGAKIVLTAWTRILKLDELDEAKIRAFIDRYEGIDHHVAGIG